MLKLSNYGISSTFNVLDLVEFRAPAITPSELFEPDPIRVSEPTLESPPNLPMQKIGLSIPWMIEPYL